MPGASDAPPPFGSLSDQVDAGVFVLGMHRSGTSAATRLVSLLGLRLPPDEDLVPLSAKNTKGYWESMSLVNFNERLLAAIGSDMRCPLLLRPGWEDDYRLDQLRNEVEETFAQPDPAGDGIEDVERRLSGERRLDLR